MDVWRSTSLGNGVLWIVTGIYLMPLLCVANWVTPQLYLRKHTINVELIEYRFGYLTLIALDLKATLHSVAYIQALERAIITGTELQELHAIVSNSDTPYTIITDVW